MKIQEIRLIVCAILLASASGCASISVRSGPLPKKGEESETPRYVYSGTQVSAEMAGLLFADIDPSSEGAGWQCFLGPMGIIDLPFCFVVDTVLLPYDVYRVTLGDRTRTGHPEQ